MEVSRKVCLGCGESKLQSAFAQGRRYCGQCRRLKEEARRGLDWRKYFATRLSSARYRNPVVTVTPEQLIEMLVEQGGKCALSGIKLTRAPGDMAKASIDRLNSKLGYEHGNVRLVCWAVNRMRNTMDDAEFMVWIEALANNGILQ